MVDHFVLRFARPPYTLIRLADDREMIGDRRSIARDFLRLPLRCQSLFSQRLMQRYPSVDALVGEWGSSHRSLG